MYIKLPSLVKDTFKKYSSTDADIYFLKYLKYVFEYLKKKYLSTNTNNLKKYLQILSNSFKYFLFFLRALPFYLGLMTLYGYLVYRPL